MIILKPVIFYPDFAGLEATWVDRTIAPDVEVAEVPATFDEEGVELTPYIPAHTVAGEVIDVPVKCHSYGPTQMQMFRDDAAELGTSVAEYEDELAEITAHYVPLPPAPPPVLIATKYKFRLALLELGLFDDIESFVAATEDHRVKIAWQYADVYQSDDPLAVGLGYALGKTDAEIRAVFELANTL